MKSFSTLGRLVLGAWLAACGAGEPDAEPRFVDVAGRSNDGVRASTSSDDRDGDSPGLVSDALGGLTPDDAVAPAANEGCTKVDFLFVVDNSLSMLEEQTALVNSFPGFMDVVKRRLGASDFHVMVVDTDAGDVRDALSSLFGQNADTCGPTLGAGRRQSQAGEDCGLASGQRYLDNSRADLPSAFSCIAEVGTLGSPREAPVEAMLASIGSTLNRTGGCNAGFLRDDAILVVTLIGDEDDGVSAGDPATWRSSLVSAKGGSADSIVFLGLIGGAGAGVSTTCSDIDPAPRLHSLIESLSFGTVGDICAADYAPFFSEAVSVIDTACADFEPVIR